MKRKILAGIFILLILLCTFLFCRYIFYYNSGNNHYERMDYPGAIEVYEKALSANPPHINRDECSVRINLALSMVFSLGDDFAKPENVQNSIATLLAAKDVLLEHDCATLVGDGHSQTAEQLKREIDELLRQLQEQNGGSSSGEENEPQSPKPEPSIEPEVEQSIQEELQQTQSSSYQERLEGLQFTEEFDSGSNLEYNNVIW